MAMVSMASLVSMVVATGSTDQHGVLLSDVAPQHALLAVAVDQ